MSTFPKLTFLLALCLLASCVPNRKVAYLQFGNEYDKPESIQPDTLIRKYQTGEFAYRLQPGDMLDIKISTLTPIIYNPFADADRNLIPGQAYTQTTDPERQVQSTGYYVEKDGYVNLPIIGKVLVGGSKISQAEDSLEVQVKKYLEKPVVRIKIQNFRFSVMGEVNRTATLISGDAYLTILQAISLAGGPSEFGDMSRVKVLRKIGDETYVFYANMMKEDYLTTPLYYVQPNDVIVVTPLKQRAYLKYASINIAMWTAVVSLALAVIALVQ
jgi:polysaccharide biosynthesis/export protein